MAVGFVPCTSCDGRSEWCDACGGRAGPLLSTASVRGTYWAEDVARAVGVERTWPRYAGKAQRIAERTLPRAARLRQQHFENEL